MQLEDMAEAPFEGMTEAPEEGAEIKLPGNLVANVERLDQEMFKSLQVGCWEQAAETLRAVPVDRGDWHPIATRVCIVHVPNLAGKWVGGGGGMPGAEDCAL
jgi:hypothetical protein